MDEATEPTLLQKRNLARTAIYLLRANHLFDMGAFCGGKHAPVEYAVRVPPLGVYVYPQYEFCFAGHGPAALKNNLATPEYWHDYITRTFGVYDMTRAALFGGMRKSCKLEICTRALIFLREGYKGILYGHYKVKNISTMTYEEIYEGLTEFCKLEITDDTD